jgi:hypothetical protein
MDLFGIKKRRAKREALMNIIKDDLLILEGRAAAESAQHSDFSRKLKNESDSTCPKCKSTNINERIKRIEGDFKSALRGSSSFGFGSISGSGSGKIDTNEVNKCNDCHHEWKKREMKYIGISKIMESHFFL